MSLALYLDHNVTAAVADGLKRRKVEILSAMDDDASEWGDERILERATSLGRVLFTHDEDFLSMSSRWLADGKHHAGIIYVHQTKLAAAKIIEDLHLIAETLSADEIRDRIMFIPF